MAQEDDINPMAQQQLDEARECEVAAKAFGHLGQELSKMIIKAHRDSEGLLEQSKGAMKVHEAINAKIPGYIEKMNDEGEWSDQEREVAFKILRLCLGSAESVSQTCQMHHEIRKGEALGLKRSSEVSAKLQSVNLQRVEELREADDSEDQRFGGRMARAKETQKRQRARRAKVAEPTNQDKPDKDVVTPDGHEALSKPQLMAKLKSLGVKVTRALSKGELVRLLKEHEDGLSDT